MVKLPKELRASLGRRAQAENRREDKNCKRMNVRAEKEQKRGRERKATESEGITTPSALDLLNSHDKPHIILSSF